MFLRFFCTMLPDNLWQIFYNNSGARFFYFWVFSQGAISLLQTDPDKQEEGLSWALLRGFLLVNLNPDDWKKCFSSRTPDNQPRALGITWGPQILITFWSPLGYFAIILWAVSYFPMCRSQWTNPIYNRGQTRSYF